MILMNEIIPQFAGARSLKLESPKTYHLSEWDLLDDPQRLATLRNIVMQYGRDPRIAMLAVKILKEKKVKPREYVKQAKVLLAWVQDNIYYVNEPFERLQSPLFTLKSGIGDCDDLTILLCSFFECIRLPWKFVLSASTPNGIVRYHENDANYPRLKYSHVYCMVGNKPFTPTKWFYCEPTLKVPLGWDVGKGTDKLPELGATFVTGTIAGSVADEGLSGHVHKIFRASLVGAITAVTTEVLLDYIKSSDIYKKYISNRKKK